MFLKSQNLRMLVNKIKYAFRSKYLKQRQILKTIHKICQVSLENNSKNALPFFFFFLPSV